MIAVDEFEYIGKVEVGNECAVYVYSHLTFEEVSKQLKKELADFKKMNLHSEAILEEQIMINKEAEKK